MFIKIINVDVERVENGTKSYEMAEVLYETDGQKRTHKVMSFVNPGVYKKVKEATKGDTFEVNVIKNPKGYNQWNAITASSSPSDTNSSSETPVRSAVSNATTSRTFETAEERAARQRLIVRQSSLSNAIDVLTTGAKAPPDPEAVKQLAEDFTKWVFEEVDLFNQPNDLPE